MTDWQKLTSEIFVKKDVFKR